MTNSPLIIADASRRQLSQLTLIRSLLLVALWIGLIIGSTGQLKASLAYLFGFLSLFSFIHLLTCFRLKNSLPVTQFEFFIQLLMDVFFLSALFYFSGGANNPFISYLLIPICISATTLAWSYTWLITGICLLNYTVLLFLYVPLPVFETSHQHLNAPNWHIIGMWFNFSLSAILITFFIIKMTRALDEQNKALSSMREDELRNEQLMAVAMQAAGAAHEMNTPLSSMTVLLSELQAENKNNPSLISDLEILKQQVKHCADTLKRLVQDSNEESGKQFKQQDIKTFCDSIINHWQLMRPKAIFSLSYNNLETRTLPQDTRLVHAVMNLLNNAADASPENIRIEISCESEQLIWIITDTGEGIHKKIGRKLGKISMSTKEQGMGIGMLLAHATIKHYGGRLHQSANIPSGTITTLILPLTP